MDAAITKRLDANWAVGTNPGGFDTGSIANTTYHVWLIRQPDTGAPAAISFTLGYPNTAGVAWEIYDHA